MCPVLECAYANPNLLCMLVLPFLLEMNSQLSCRFGMPEVLSSVQAFSNREKHQQKYPCNSFPGMCILLAWLGNGSRHSVHGWLGNGRC